VACGESLHRGHNGHPSSVPPLQPSRAPFLLFASNAPEPSSQSIRKWVVAAAHASDVVTGLMSADRPAGLTGLVVHEKLPRNVPISRPTTNLQRAVDVKRDVELEVVEAVEDHGIYSPNGCTSGLVGGGCHWDRAVLLLLLDTPRWKHAPNWRVPDRVGSNPDLQCDPLVAPPLLPLRALSLESYSSSLTTLGKFEQILPLPTVSRAECTAPIDPVEVQKVGHRLVPIGRLS